MRCTGDARQRPALCHRHCVHDPYRPGAHEWLHLVMLWGIGNAFKFVLNGPVNLICLVSVVVGESLRQLGHAEDWRKVCVGSDS